MDMPTEVFWVIAALVFLAVVIAIIMSLSDGSFQIIEVILGFFRSLRGG